MSGICFAINNRPSPQVQQANTNVARGAELPPRVSRGVAFTSAMWEPSRILRVRFLEGTDQQKKSVANWASEWSKYANVLFAFDSTDQNAEIQVKFSNDGNWSAVGTASLDRGGCTMNIHDLNQGTVQHEFGHAIGMEHEHESPVNAIQWNTEVVYRELGGPPNNWDRETVKRNIFQAFDKSQTQFTRVDPTSVMMYEIPARWTTNGYSVARNNGLSATDKAFVGALYPGTAALFGRPDILAARCTVKTGPGTTYNQAYGNSWIMNFPGESFIEVNFNEPKTFEGKKIWTRANLRLTHLSSTGGGGFLSPINIVVNGSAIKTSYSPPSGNWMEDVFDISAQMKDGDNNVRLEFQRGAQMNYWINSLKVNCSGGEQIRVA
jgi:hypothetical protein